MKVTELEIPGVKLLEPHRHRDHRGFFSETYSAKVFADAGIIDVFVQDNHSFSVDQGVVRGLHFQKPPSAQAKLVRVSRGAILDVAVDLRHGSPTFGRHVSAELSADNWRQLLVPSGCAHGFCTLTPDTEVIYKVTDYYSPEDDAGIAWDDPNLGIVWPVDGQTAILSSKDREHPRLVDLPVFFHG